MTANVFGTAHSLFYSGTWEALRIALIAFAVLFWLATVFWVWKDARRRIDSDWLVMLATLIGAVPPLLGPLVYLLFRPPEYLEDVRERELEIRAIESRLGSRELECTVCGCELEPEFLVCPVCTTRLRSACTACGRPLEPAWQVCPYCEAPVPVGGPVALAPRPSHRRSRSPSSG